MVNRVVACLRMRDDKPLTFISDSKDKFPWRKMNLVD